MKSIKHHVQKSFLMVLVAALVFMGVNVLTSGTVSAYTTGATFITYVTTANVNVRSGAGTSYSTYGTIPKYTPIESGQVIGTSGSWTKVRIFNSSTEKTGYIESSYLKKTSSNRFYSATANINLRTGPGTSYTLRDTLPKGCSQLVFYNYKVSANGYTWVVMMGYNDTVNVGSSGYQICTHTWVAFDYFE